MDFWSVRMEWKKITTQIFVFFQWTVSYELTERAAWKEIIRKMSDGTSRDFSNLIGIVLRTVYQLKQTDIQYIIEKINQVDKFRLFTHWKGSCSTYFRNWYWGQYCWFRSRCEEDMMLIFYFFFSQNLTANSILLKWFGDTLRLHSERNGNIASKSRRSSFHYSLSPFQQRW